MSAVQMFAYAKTPKHSQRPLTKFVRCVWQHSTAVGTMEMHSCKVADTTGFNSLKQVPFARSWGMNPSYWLLANLLTGLDCRPFARPLDIAARPDLRQRCRFAAEAKATSGFELSHSILRALIRTEC